MANRRADTAYWQQGDRICACREVKGDCGDNLQLRKIIYLLCNCK